jgi:archaeal type IV pilus assembly protein PilA
VNPFLGCLKKEFTIMAYTRKNDEAVSPVIGVILMVAITVILAAVIAAFVFGMSGNISKTKVVAVTAQQPDGQTITTTYQGGQDAQSFTSGLVTVTPSATCTGSVTYDNATTTAQTKGYFSNTVGSWVTAKCSAPTTGGFSGKDHVVVTGTFSDGSNQVMLDTYV